MPTLAEYERGVLELCLRPEPAPDAPAPLGDDAWRWTRYRSMVRHRLLEVAENALPRFRTAIGEERCAELFARFLDAGGPRSAFLRDVSGEFLAWLERSGASDELPVLALDLARYEHARVAVSYAEDGPAPDAAGPLDMGRRAVLLHAHRLVAVSHAVHRSDGTDLPRERTWLCVYRAPGTFEVKTLELNAAAHALLSEMSTGERTLAGAIEASASRAEAPLSRDFLAATSALLADLVERGLLVG